MKFGKFVVKYKTALLIIGILLLFPSFLGIVNTHINYDMLTYLPKDMETVKGQDILLNDFGKGAFSFLIVEDMEPKDIASLEAKIEAVDNVDSVIWYDDVMDLSVPMEMLPKEVYNAFNKDGETLLAIFFDTSTSEDATISAVKEIRSIAGKQCYLSGLSALVADLKALCEKEEPIYTAVAVACACAAMMLFLDSWLVPFIFLASIGMAIIYNMGSNFLLGEISYITKALAAILQLAVTMDYSIFLWHSYTEEKENYPDKKEAMAAAVSSTLSAVLGSSLTTIAGFLAMCFMSYTMGADLGIVMAKGVLIGVICSVTILPSMILCLDKPLEKTKHTPLIRRMDKFAGAVTKRSWAFILVFLLLSVPAWYGYNHTGLFYDFTSIFTGSDNGFNPDDVRFLEASQKLADDFGVSSTHMILCSKDMQPKDAKAMLEKIKGLDGVSAVFGLDSIPGSDIPKEMLPDALLDVLESGDYQLILVNSEYSASTEEVNAQTDQIYSILKEYDQKGMLIGEAPLTKDLISVTDKDFRVVNIMSVVMVFAIILFFMKSISLPFILIAVIEFAVFINLGIPYYTGTSLLFLAPICISTIQLGSTVDYAILMTTRYKRERLAGNDKHTAATTALSTSMPSILVSALCFFAATFGVSIFSDINIISSMCQLLSRGAIVSMLSVIFVLPAMLILFDKIIIKTTLDTRRSIAASKV
ncbi:MAG: MMPL family transporter [Clostridiaceae bacterium]|nr:MMPL family transporter [Clostridiaceae bacterium]